MVRAKVIESENQAFGGLLKRVFVNIVRGFSLVLPDPEWSRHRMWR
jgi:hypothetical protein